MRTPFPPDSERFYARVRAAQLECPRCGNLLAFNTNEIRGCTWNPRTNRLNCNPCGLTVQLGILAWPVLEGGAAHHPTPPRDQVPNERQLAQLRGWGGTWMPDSQRVKAKRAPHSNITAKCTCRDRLSGVKCPLHPEGIGNW